MVTLKASVPLAPNFTSPNNKLVFERVRHAMAVPVSVTCCGLVVALSSIAIDALCAPVVLGVKATPSVHDAPCASVTGIAPHVPVPLKTYSESDGVALEMTSE